MSIKQHNDSHLDHNLTEAQVAFILKLKAKQGELTIQTIDLPEELGTVPCSLYGPVMGDLPLTESDVYYRVRGDRKGESRMVSLPSRPCTKVTVISGPHDGNECVLFTAFGGPQAPRELFEFTLAKDFVSFEESAAILFWKEHALAD